MEGQVPPLRSRAKSHPDPLPGKNPFDDKNNPPTCTGPSNADKLADSDPLTVDDYTGDPLKKTGLYALENADLFNLLCIPPDVRGDDMPSFPYGDVAAYCQKRRAFYIVDGLTSWDKDLTALKGKATVAISADLNLTGEAARNAAVFFPHITETDPFTGRSDQFPPSGALAGIFARTDNTRGVWKAPAGIDATFTGILGLSLTLTNEENGIFNPVGLNCLRTFPVYGSVVWGTRTTRGADQLTDDYKYIPVRRLALFIEESLYRGTQWAVFEPNDEPLWAQLRLNVGSFMQDLFRNGAFQGSTPSQAYFVKCDSSTTTQRDIDLGKVIVVVGFAPLKPAEFVILRIQQIAGQTQT